MIVIHPNDKATSFLKAIYAGKRNVIIDETWSNRNIRECIGSSPSDEIIMMLGHGYRGGLFAPSKISPYGRNIVDRKLVYLLKEHICIGIWDQANMFAKYNDLKGLFTGKLILNKDTADSMGVDYEGEDIPLLNNQYASDLEYCIRNNDLPYVPQAMLNVQDYSSDIKDFNYKSLYYYQ